MRHSSCIRLSAHALRLLALAHLLAGLLCSRTSAHARSTRIYPLCRGEPGIVNYRECRGRTMWVCSECTFGRTGWAMVQQCLLLRHALLGRRLIHRELKSTSSCLLTMPILWYPRLHPGYESYRETVPRLLCVEVSRRMNCVG